MYACGFNMFHYTHYMKIIPVKNCIYFSFLATIQEMAIRPIPRTAMMVKRLPTAQQGGCPGWVSGPAASG